MSTPNGERERLEREANLARARLADTLGALDRRAHDVVDLQLQIRRHARPLIIAGAIVGVSALGLASLGIYRFATRDARRRRDRFLAVRRLWMHPERVARSEPPSIPAAIGRKLLVGAVTIVATTLLKRAIAGR